MYDNLFWRSIVTLVYWVCGHSLEKLYDVSKTPSQYPHGVSKANEKVTFVPKKTHQHFSLLYNQNTNLSSKILKSCHTLFSLKSHFSKIKFLSLSSFFSLEFESHLSQIFNSNLIHALTQIPFHPKLAPPNYAIAPFILAFFHPPLHCTAAIPKYPWSNNHKEPSPSHISHYFIYYLLFIYLLFFCN